VAQHGYNGLAVATLMAGVMLIIMGFAGFGSIIKYIPYPVTVGFTTGIALIIFAGQIKDLLGLHVEKVPADFIEKIMTYGRYIGTVNPLAAGVGVVTVLIVLHWKRVTQRVPGSLVAILATTAAVQVAWACGMDFELETIGQRFPAVAEGMRIQAPRLPLVSLETFRTLFSPAISIALLAGIESLLSAVVADGMTGQRHHSNTELIGQGLANVVSPLFGGIPATGTIARTVTNIRAGATSPVAGMVHALTLLVVMLVAAPLAGDVPLAALSAILMFVAWNMGEWHEFVNLRQFRLPYRATLLSVFLLTVIVDLTVAVEAGLIAACLTFIYRISSLSRAEQMQPDAYPQLAGHETAVHAHRLYGALFFGAVKLVEAIEEDLPAQALVLDFKNLIYVDSSGADALLALARSCKKKRVRLILCGLAHQPLDIAERSGLLHALPDTDLAADLNQGLALALGR
jgi:SulP family sulfate permease